MNDRPEQKGQEEQSWEDRINALLDGELDATEAEQLRAAAGDDPALARAIIDAYQLKQALEAIPTERAPDSLRRRLAAIPQQERRQHRRIARPAWAESRWFGPAWMTALAAVPLLVIALAVWAPQQTRTSEPSLAEINQARQELAVALAYLGKVGRMTNQEIGETVNAEMQETVNENMIQAIQDQMEFNKERSA
jgi:anti-sigma factor RsiW